MDSAVYCGGGAGQSAGTDEVVVVETGDGLTLGELLSMAQRVLEIRSFLVDGHLLDTQMDISGTPVAREADFLGFFERALFDRGLVHQEERISDELVHSIHEIGGGGGDRWSADLEQAVERLQGVEAKDGR